MTNEEKRDLTVALGEKVMGWLYWDGQGDWPQGDHPGATCFTDWKADPPMRGVDVYEDGSEDVTLRWWPLDNMADAWAVVKALGNRRFFMQFTYDPSISEAFRCQVFAVDEDGIPTALISDEAERTMPEAIAKAALKAVSA